MKFSSRVVVALSAAFALAALVLLFLPKDWILYVVVGGTMLFIGFFMAFNIFLLFIRERRKHRNPSRRTD
jgi:amino acid transporter